MECKFFCAEKKKRFRINDNLRKTSFFEIRLYFVSNKCVFDLKTIHAYHKTIFKRKTCTNFISKIYKVNISFYLNRYLMWNHITFLIKCIEKMKVYKQWNAFFLNYQIRIGILCNILTLFFFSRITVNKY